jgi:hypothetical protein
MSDHDDLDSAESAASSALAAALRAPAGAARASALAHASRGLSALRVALACAAPAQLPPAALFSRAQQLRSFEATEARLRAEVAADARDARAADESPAANAVETALAASTPAAAAAVPAPPAPAPARGAAAAAAASGSGDGGGGGVSGALSRTRASLAGESERLSALGELLAADSGALVRRRATTCGGGAARGDLAHALCSPPCPPACSRAPRRTMRLSKPRSPTPSSA